MNTLRHDPYSSLSRLAFVALVTMTSFSACKEAGPRVVPVSGRVTHLGKPVPDLIISFVPESGGRPSNARLGQDGRFTLAYSLEGEGAEVGKHTVSVSYVPKDPGEEMALIEGSKAFPKELTAILEKYGDPQSSPFKTEITEATTDLEIKLD